MFLPAIGALLLLVNVTSMVNSLFTSTLLIGVIVMVVGILPTVYSTALLSTPFTVSLPAYVAVTVNVPSATV